MPSEAGAFPEPHCCSGAWGSLPDTPGCWGAASPHPSSPTSHCQDLPSSPRQPRGHQPTPAAGGSPHPCAVRPGVSGYQLTGAPWQDRAARPPPAPQHPWVHAEHQDEPSAGRSLLRAGLLCSRSPFPAGVFPWPGNRLAQPAASPGTITRPRCSRPSLPQGFLPGVWLALPTETSCADTALVLGSLQLGCWAPTPAGQGAQTRGSPPLSSPRSPGRVLLPSPLCFNLRSLARARGALRHARTGCPCPHGPRRGKGGDIGVCPGELAENGRTLEERESPGCRLSSIAQPALLFALVTPGLI